MSSTILVVDDEESILKTLGGVLEDEGYRIATAMDGMEALAVAQREMPDLVMLDIWMPRMEGLEALQHLKELYPELTVIMMSGHGTIETAVKATKMGAFDFIEKPLSLEKVILTVNNALRLSRLKQENASLRGLVSQEYRMVGGSVATVRLKEQIGLVAPSPASVLITGENGSGKELTARLLHLQSSRREKPLVTANCAAIPEELLEQELFGHEKGAFPGAAAMRKGRLDQADGGTLYLEEVCDLSVRAQAGLLRFLEEGVFTRSGGTRNLDADVRLVASTRRRIEDEVKAGRFREDLFYRLNVVRFSLLPLRERKEDVPALVEYFLGMFCQREGRESRTIEPAVVEMMKAYDWPGNVRELKNLIERLVIVSTGEVITAAEIPDYMVSGQSLQYNEESRSGSNLRIAREQFEREFIVRKLEENRWDLGATAEAIKLDRSSLQRKIRQYGINYPDRG